MRFVRSIALRRAGGFAAVAGLTVLGVAGLPPAAAPAATLASPPQVDRFNVGAAHSPQLLRALAGPASPTSLVHPVGAGGAPSPGLASPALAPPALASPALASPALASPALASPDGPAATAAVRGVDVASYQHVNGGGINWSMVAAAGYKFTAIKAAEGNYYANPYRAADLAGAEKAKLSVIGYEFAIPNASGGAAQADYVIAHAADQSGRVAPIGLDIEYDPYSATDRTNECYGLSRAAMTSWVAAFSREVRRKTGRLPVLYTTADWWNTCAGSTALGEDPLWVAAYTTAAGPPLPAGWGTWAIWQYSSTGTVPGIATSRGTDMDVLNTHSVPVFNPGDQAVREGAAVAPVQAAMLAVAGRAAPSYTASGLPPGLSIGAATGQIAGTAATAGVYHVKVTATSGALTGSASFTWTVIQGLPTSAVGAVPLDLGGKCLTDAGDSRAAGATVETWSCDGGSHQNWSVAQDGTIQIHGLCLAATGTVSGSKVVLAACSTAASQQWQAGTGGELVNAGSGACLDDPSSSTANGVALWVHTCNGDASQKWTLPAGPILSQVTGRCLDNRYGSVANGNKVQIWACNGYGAQKWAAQADGTVRTLGSCLDIYHGGTAAGSVVDLFACNGTAAQQWRLLADGSAVKLQNPKSGLCLSDPADATVNGTGLVLGTCASTGAGTAWLVR